MKCLNLLFRFLIFKDMRLGKAADDEANLQWVSDFVADMAVFSDGSRYLNFAGFQEEGDAMMRKAFGPQHERLVALKRKYDPTNFFSRNRTSSPHSEATNVGNGRCSYE